VAKSHLKSSCYKGNDGTLSGTPVIFVIANVCHLSLAIRANLAPDFGRFELWRIFVNYLHRTLAALCRDAVTYLQFIGRSSDNGSAKPRSRGIGLDAGSLSEFNRRDRFRDG
jgi:hypothetical protein